MKINKSHFDNYRKILQIGSYLLLAALLPVTQEYLPYLMGLWVVGAVFSIRKYSTIHFSKSLLVFMPAFLFAISFISLFFSKDVSEGLIFIEKWLSVSVISIATLFVTNKVVTKGKYFNSVFIISSLLVVLYCLVVAFENSLSRDQAGNLLFMPSYYRGLSDYSFIKLLLLRYSHFSGGFFSQVHHPTYFAMFITFSIGILFYFLHKVRKRKLVFLYILGIFFFLLMNFLLASRAGYVTTVLLIVFSFIWFFHRKVKRRYIVIGSIILLLTAGFLLMKTRLGNNMRQVVALVFDEEVPKEKLDERLLLWNVGEDLAREAPLWGYGIGDVQDKLNMAYRERGMENAVDKNLNVHNQYLSVYLATGIFGLAALLYWFFGSLILGIRTRNYLLSVFMLIIIINALFENILDRSAGLAFILLFYPLLMQQSLKKKPAINKQA